jgi:cytochrome oxidase Cu insertion factor (SCO1/SenC/PrrC family)
MDVARPMRRIPVLLLIALVAFAVNPLRAAESTVPRSAPVGIGDLAPDFTLVDQDGQSHTLSKERTTQDAVVLIFYRGHW